MATILIADDDAGNRDYLRALLGSSGHRVVEAIDGAEGLARTRGERPDLVISDFVMPGMDGFEFIRILRTLPGLAGTPVVFCTATYLEREARELARMCGVEQVLMKPCEPEKVLRAVQQALHAQAERLLTP